jgi:hypothetical protein
MQHHRKTTGNIYELIGTMTPCNCAAGDEVERGYRRDADGTIRRTATGIFRQFFKEPITMPSITTDDF